MPSEFAPISPKPWAIAPMPAGGAKTPGGGAKGPALGGEGTMFRERMSRCAAVRTGAMVR